MLLVGTKVTAIGRVILKGGENGIKMVFPAKDHEFILTKKTYEEIVRGYRFLLFGCFAFVTESGHKIVERKGRQKQMYHEAEIAQEQMFLDRSTLNIKMTELTNNLVKAQKCLDGECLLSESILRLRTPKISVHSVHNHQSLPPVIKTRRASSAS